MVVMDGYPSLPLVCRRATVCSRLPIALGLARWRRGLVWGHLLAAIALVLVVLLVRARCAFVRVLHVRAVVLRSDFLGHVLLQMGRYAMSKMK